MNISPHSSSPFMNTRTALVLFSTKPKILSHFLTTQISSKSSKSRVTLNKLKNSVKLTQTQTEVQTQLKQDWLESLSCPFVGPTPISSCVVGIDPDGSGALAVLKLDNEGYLSPQVFDSPHLKTMVGGRVRKRLDAKAIVQLLHSIDAPSGTTAYIEQSTPYPKDGKQGWYSGGFAYGLWIGVLVASGFSVVPVTSATWKKEFELSGNSSTKDDSRMVASMLFPSMSSELTRKKDHGRAEALLIAAYGQGLKAKSESVEILE